MKYTEQQIKGIGGRRYINRRIKRILLLLALTIGWIFVCKAMMLKPSPVILYAPLVLVVINIVMGFVQARKVFYNKAKANPELLD